MDLYIIRHAIAEDREVFAETGKEDCLRPLIEKGRHRITHIAEKFHKLSGEVSLIATSPYLRTLQTAKIFQKHYPKAEFVEVPELVPEASIPAAVKWLSAIKAHDTMMVIGHEPMLSELACWLLTEQPHTFCYFKKGGIMHLRFPETLQAGAAMLQAYYPPKLFRAPES